MTHSSSHSPMDGSSTVTTPVTSSIFVRVPAVPAALPAGESTWEERQFFAVVYEQLAEPGNVDCPTNFDGFADFLSEVHARDQQVLIQAPGVASWPRARRYALAAICADNHVCLDIDPIS